MVNHNKDRGVLFRVAIRNVPRFVIRKFLLEIFVLKLVALIFIWSIAHWGTSTNDSVRFSSVPERIKQVEIQLYAFCLVSRARPGGPKVSPNKKTLKKMGEDERDSA